MRTHSWYLNAQLARVAHMMPELDLTDLSLAREATVKFKNFAGTASDDERITIHEEMIDNPDHSQPLTLRVYRPKNSKGDLPCMIYMHGGGFVLGNLEMEDFRCQKISGDVNCVVVAVDFRLAPEFAFPCGLNDCYLALSWVAENAPRLGVKKDKLAVGGCSSGATLSAAVALMARDKGGPALCFQFLLYPALDDRLNTPSMLTLKDIPCGDRSHAALMWGYYLSGLEGEVPYLAAPARAQDLSGLPSTYIMTNDIDVCRDEDIDFAKRLLAAGVPTELHSYSGTFHAFEVMVRSADISVKALEQQMYVLRRALHSPDFTYFGKTDESGQPPLFSADNDTSVIVVGAGPVGLATALALNSFGVPVTVLEACGQDHARPGSRALFLHNDSLSLLERFSSGLGKSLAEQGILWDTRETRYANRCVYTKALDTHKTINGLPPFTSLRQSDTERLLRLACEKEGIRIKWGEALEGLSITEGQVTLATSRGSITAPYVVGADGAHSVVRKSVGLMLEGDTTEGRHIVVDFVRPNTPYRARRTFHYRHPGLDGRHVLVIPFAGGWQVDLQCLLDDDVEHMASEIGLAEWLPKVIDKRYLLDINWVSTYRFNQVVANDFADTHRQVLLVGEAAHLFPPYGARGLNSGIADAEQAACAIALARQAASSHRRVTVIEDFVRSRRSAALRNCEAARKALRAIRTPTLFDKAKQGAAVILSSCWSPAARWLDTAPYGPVWKDRQHPSRY